MEWFVSAVDYSANNSDTSALVTGPLSKDHFAHPKINGHTSYLKNRFKNDDLFMTFLGSIYHCLLLTDHLPLLKLTEDLIDARLKKALKLLPTLKETLGLKKPIGVLGLNPHAGENGLIGEEESRTHKKRVENLSDIDIGNIAGPLSGDGFFSVEDYKKYSLIIANYHDQGLIPFKLIHGFEGCQTTLGLPFVRTSVNHGTATKLYLKNKADESSLIQAFQAAKKLLMWRSKNNDI